MIYTSYFGKLKKIPENFTTVSICAGTPKWYNGLTFKKLAPTYHTLMTYKEDSDWDQYTKEYTETVLQKQNAKSVVTELQKLTGNAENIVLLCYERPEDLCHRHLVARWLTENGYPCEELTV